MNLTGKKESLPLEGLVVVDLTRLLPGPLCTMLLGDYGAEVIKIEDTGAGDPTRFVGRTFKGSGSFFRQLNRNKKSLALNLKTGEGVSVVKKLAAKADLLVEGFRPGVLEKLDLGYNGLVRTNKRLVYASITGYGQSGSYSAKAGHDINYTALSGVLAINTAKGRLPEVPGLQIADISAGALTALNGIMFALYRREKSGEGSYVDISMTRGLLPFLALAAGAYNSGEETAKQKGGPITGAYACYNIYETADGKAVSLGALEPVFWQRFCEKISRPDWTVLQYDSQQRTYLIEELGEIIKSKTRDEWVEYFIDTDACFEPVLELEEAIDHTLSRENDYWLREKDEKGESELTAGYPLLISGSGGSKRKSPPRHGEDTADILTTLGYGRQEIELMADKGIVKVENRYP